MVIKLIHTGIVNLIAVTYIFSSPSSYSQDLTKYETSQNAINFLGEDFMKSSNHQVNPKATKIGYMLEYEIINNGKTKIKESLVVQIETSPIPLYKNEKTFSYICNQLENLDFDFTLAIKPKIIEKGNSRYERKDGFL